jgi:hypothetical protein
MFSSNRRRASTVSAATDSGLSEALPPDTGAQPAAAISARSRLGESLANAMDLRKEFPKS